MFGEGIETVEGALGVRSFNRAREYAPANIARALLMAGGCGKYERPIGGRLLRTVAAQLAVQARKEIHSAYSRISLRVPDVDRLANRIHIAPAQGERLSDPE